MNPSRWFGNFMLRNGPVLGVFLLAAVGFWIFIMILAPQVAMVDFSFRHNLPPADQGGHKDVYTLEHYEFMVYAAPRPPARSTPST